LTAPRFLGRAAAATPIVLLFASGIALGATDMGVGGMCGLTGSQPGGLYDKE